CLSSGLMMDPPHTDFFYCCGAATELLRFGSRPLTSAHKVLFLIIPGERSSLFGCSDISDDVFGLDGQVEHKLAFLRNHVPRETSLVLIGHSIGCYIILEMMKRNPERKVLKALLLFPTIERMAQSPQGKVMTPVLCHMRYVVYLPLFLLSLLPDRLKVGLIRLTRLQPVQIEHFNLCGLFPRAANAMYLGGQEMRKVLKRDDTTIGKHLDKVRKAPPTRGANENESQIRLSSCLRRSPLSTETLSNRK
uniref:Lipid droplet-associated hydrolase n=1 Tax=Neolamprologus brichardi TaxID=32507 RepID=A0A3Q4MFY6_NEOBR